MSRNWNLFLDDIIAGCRYVDEFTRGMSQESFLADPKTYWATIKMNEIIGEATRYIPDEIRAQVPKVEWANTVATRNIFAHRYFGIDEEILWDIIQVDIPELLVNVLKLERASNDEQN